MKDLFAGLLSLIESKEIPAAYKFLVGAAVLAILLRVAGFPVVKYVETGVREAFEKVPYLFGASVGVLIGSLVPHMLKNVTRVLITLFITAFGVSKLSNEERQSFLQFASIVTLLMFAILFGYAAFTLFAARPG